MRIQKIEIVNFGKLSAFEMEFEAGLNTIQADNGWGKSTLAAFLKAMFYGLDYTTKRSLKENERKKYFPWQGGAFGGSMVFSVGDKSYRVERFFGAKDKEDTFTLYDLETGLQSEDYSERLGEELFHLDRAAFSQSSYFAQQDFLPVLNDSLNAGLTHVEEHAGDIQNYEKAYASLEDRMKFYQKTGDRGEIPRLLEERRRVQEQLSDCQRKEEALQNWKQGILEKEQQEKEQRKKVQQLENELQAVQSYEAKKAQKEQLELLRQQAGMKEEQLRQTAQALGEYNQEPIKEEELDRIREQIFHLKSLKLQEEDAEKTLQKANAAYQDAKLALEACPAAGNGILMLLFSVILMGAGAACLVVMEMPLMLLGVAAIIAGIVFLAYGRKKRGQQKQKRTELEERLSQAVLEKEQAEEQAASYKKRDEKIRQAIRQKIYFPENALPEDVEHYWKLERQHSQQYGILKSTYAALQQDAKRSKDAYAALRGKYSEEQLRAFQNLEEPKQGPKELKASLQFAKERLEMMQRDRTRMEHQLTVLKDAAEQIPDLEEEISRIAQKAEESQKEHDLLEKTLKYLKTAREQFQTRYLKELQAGLEHYQKYLEPEEETEASLDVKLKIKVREAGAARDMEYFSTGWQDLWKIAERFAIVDALYKEEQPVLILDDPFINLDEKKKARAMKLLQEQAVNRQMIYFTCSSFGEK